jgi:hypothetical protein
MGETVARLAGIIVERAGLGDQVSLLVILGCICASED